MNFVPLFAALFSAGFANAHEVPALEIGPYALASGQCTKDVTVKAFDGNSLTLFFAIRDSRYPCRGAICRWGHTFITIDGPRQFTLQDDRDICVFRKR